MKKVLTLFLALMLCLSLAAPALAAETSGKCGENVTWSYNDGTLTISGTGKMEDYYDADANALSMPPWGDYLRQIETLNIGDGVTRIGVGAFDSCTNLTSVTIPNSVTTIGMNAFSLCDKLTSVTIPDSVTAIGDAAFYNCNGLTGVTIPNSVTTIGSGAFASCTSLAGIEVASGNPAYSSAGGVLFNADQTLLLTYPAGKSDASYNIPASVTSIEAYAFFGCRALTGVTIPDSVTTIGTSAFYDCRALTSVTIPDSVTTIGGAAFYNCNGLTGVTISNSVTTIGDYTFTYSKFANVTIPDSVTAIGEGAFAYNTALTSVTIPGGVTTIGGGAFEMCLGLTSVTILDGVTTIEGGAFVYCSKLTSVTIPASVTTIGPQAFGGTSLTDVYYGGNESQWQQIEISDEWDGALPLYNATMHYNSAGPAPEPIPATGTAHPSAQAVELDGKKVEFQMYALLDEAGDPTNYIKVRDLALAMNGTKGQFNVDWINDTVTLVAGAPYTTPNGSENSTPFSGERSYKLPENSTNVNGAAGGLTAFVLTDDEGGDYTYYQLRDLGKALGFNVGWSEERGVFIESDKPYTDAD